MGGEGREGRGGKGETIKKLSERQSMRQLLLVTVFIIS